MKVEKARTNEKNIIESQSIGIKLFLNKSLNAEFINKYIASMIVNLKISKCEDTQKDMSLNSTNFD